MYPLALLCLDTVFTRVYKRLGEIEKSHFDKAQVGRIQYKYRLVHLKYRGRMQPAKHSDL